MTTLAPIHTAKLTADQYFQLGEDPPGVRLELIDGEIVVSPSPSPTHAKVVQRLFYLLETHNRAHKLGDFYLDTDVVFEPFYARRPDIAFYGKAKLRKMTGDRLTLPPDLCIEVISPSNPDDDRINNFDMYQKHGVGHYWIIDPDARTAECLKLRGGKYVKVREGAEFEKVHFPPFADLKMPLAELWLGQA